MFLEKPKYFIFFSKIWWSLVSDTFCKLIKIIPVKRPFWNPVVILSVRCPRQVFSKNQTETCTKVCSYSKVPLFGHEQSFQCPRKVFVEYFFRKTRLKPVQKIVLTQKFLCLVMNNPFSSF